MRHPFRFRDLAAVAATVAALAVGVARARADVVPEHGDKFPPPCTAPGQTCQTDGLEDVQQGTCVAATCTKQVRNHRDGVTTPVAVPCFECRKGGAGQSKSPPKSKSSGCAVSPERGDTGALALAVSLAAGLMLVARAFLLPCSRRHHHRPPSG